MYPEYRNRRNLVAALTLQIVVLLSLGGCSDRDLTGLEEATADADPVVFEDGFGNSLDYSAFLDSYYDALSIDETVSYSGTASLKVAIPGGQWAGGAFWTHSPRDLGDFNALTFYARSSSVLNLDACGLGLDVNSSSDYQIDMTDVPLNADWSQVIIPIPLPELLANEGGMFWFSESEAGGWPVDVWFDEVMFVDMPTIINPRPVLDSDTVEALVGEAIPIEGTRTTFAVNGEDVEVAHTPLYFKYFSSDESVVVAEDGLVTAVGGGTAIVTAKLDTATVDGAVTVNVVAPPSTPAPAPTLAPADVISIFSDAYTDITVDSWLAEWSTSSGVYDQQIDGDNVKAYTGLDTPYKFASIDFQSNQIDATAAGMTHFHLDVWARTGTLFYLELIDFGPNGVYDAFGDDTKKKLLFHALTDPPFVTGEWSSLDIPLSTFTNMNFNNVAQFNIQTGDGSTVYLDNVYLHR